MVADVQTGGVGRRGRGWDSPKGNLYASIVIRRRFAPALAPAYSLVTAVAVAEGVESVVGARAAVTLKWPNDVLLADRKLVGLLLEADGEHLIVGMGINVSFAPVPEAASLAALGLAPSLPALLGSILARLDDGARDLEEDRLETWRQGWLARAAWLGQPIRVHLEGGIVAGVHRGIDPTGALRLETDGEVRVILAGDVERMRLEGKD